MRLLSKIKKVRVATIVTDMVFVLKNVEVRHLMQSEAGIKPWNIPRIYQYDKDWYKNISRCVIDCGAIPRQDR